MQVGSSELQTASSQPLYLLPLTTSGIEVDGQSHERAKDQSDLGVGVVVRLGRGAHTPTFEIDLRERVPELGAETLLYVFECSFTNAELGEFLDYQRSGAWKDEDSVATQILPPQLLRELLRGGIADCLVIHPIQCLSETEIQAISVEASRLNISHVDLRHGAREDICIDPDTRLGPPSVLSTADQDCDQHS